MKKLFVFVGLVTWNLAFAQFLSFDYVGQVAGGFTAGEYPRDVVLDNWNHRIAVGAFKGTVDFDPKATVISRTAISDDDIFILKTTPSGHLDWIVTIGTTGTGFRYNSAYSVAADSLRNIYVVGRFKGTADFNPGVGVYNLSSGGSYATFILKLNSSGVFVWAKKLESGNYGTPSVKVDEKGSIYVSGEYNGTVDFDPGTGIYMKSTPTTAYSNTYLLKLNANGQFVWARTFDSNLWGYFQSSSVNAEGTSTITGKAITHLDANPGVGVYNLFNANLPYLFIIQIDSSGTFKWARKLNGLDGYNYSVEQDNFGDIVLSGTFSGTKDFNPGPGIYNLTSTNTLNFSMFVLKLNAAGDFIWAEKFGGIGDCIPLDIKIDSRRNIYISGEFETTVDFMPGPLSYTKTSNGDYDIFILKLSPNHDLMYVESFGSAFWDSGDAISVGKSGKLCVAGKFVGIVDFDPDTSSAILTNTDFPSYAYSDMFLLNYSCSSNWGVDSVISCGPITWLDGLTYTANTTQPTFTLINRGGGDSIVSLIFTIDTNYFETGVDFITSCGPLTWIDGNTYSTNNNSATHTLNNRYGCDSIVTLNLTIDTAHTVSGIDKISSCGSYTWIDGQNYTSSNTTATMTLVSSTGCDSVVTLGLTINPIKSFDHKLNVCDSLTWINGMTYTASTKDTLWMSTYAGCDSVVSLDLTIYQPQASFDTIFGCDSYTWINGITYYTNNNTAQATIPSYAGCDSVVNLVLEINQSNSGVDSILACEDFQWIDGNTYTASNNTATFVIPNSKGCDSLVTLNMTMHKLNPNIFQKQDTLIAQEKNATYQWVDCNNNMNPIAGATQRKFHLTTSGSFAVELNYLNCIVTTNCQVVANIDLEEWPLKNAKAFPNPSNGEVKIDWDETKNPKAIKVYNSIGELIFAIDDIHDSATTIHFDESGVYQIHYYVDQLFKVEQIVVLK